MGSLSATAHRLPKNTSQIGLSENSLIIFRVMFPRYSQDIPQHSHLVGGLEHGFYDFPMHVGNVIIPTDFQSIIFQRG